MTSVSPPSPAHSATTTSPPQIWPPKLAPPGAGMPPGITYGHRRAGPHGEPTTLDWATSPVGEAVSAFARPGICHSGGVSGGGLPAQLGTRPQQTPKHDALRFRQEATARTTLPGACCRAGD